MALSASGLSAALKAKLLANGATLAQDSSALQALCDEIAAAVVEHVTANAVVIPTLLVAPSGGGPVTGTGSIT